MVNSPSELGAGERRERSRAGAEHAPALGSSNLNPFGDLHAVQHLSARLAKSLKGHFEPLVGELFRSGFLMQASAANHDFITPPVISAAEADYERNLANTIDLAYLLVNDPHHGDHNRQLFQGWVAKHLALADKAALGLQPIWSMPHSKPVAFTDVRAQSQERLARILGELGLKR